MKSNNLVWVFEQFQAIRATSSRLEKGRILKEIVKLEKPLLRDILHHTYHPFLNYNVRLDDVNVWKPTYNRSEPTAACWPRFLETLNAMNDGKISGGAARKQVETVMSPLGDTIRHWLTCILNRDLKMGVSGKTIAKFFPSLLPEVAPMLCHPLDMKDELLVKMVEGWYMEPKYDGLRALCVIQKGKLKFLSRAGRDMWNTEIIEDEILAMGLDDCVIDGELLAKDWNQTISIVHSQKRHGQRGDLKYYIFDLIPLEHWCKKETVPLEVRKTMLRRVLPKGHGKAHLVRVPLFVLQSKHDVHGHTLKSGLKELLSQGHEGGVVKDPNSKYEWGRSKKWLKVKPYYEADFTIYALEEGTGKNKGKLGAFRVSGQLEWKGTVYEVDTRVGGGYTDKQREEFWARGKKMHGIDITTEFQEPSIKKGSNLAALRFPVFLRERKDK